jgi:PHP domain
LKYLKERLGEKSSRVIVEDTNIRSAGILTNHGFNAITGSDVRNWDNYGDCEVSSLRLPINTFKQFCLFLDRDKSTIETMLNKTPRHEYTGRPKEDDPSITIPVKLYNEVNILFGDKGLGKTNILKSVRAEAEAGGKKVSTYIASEKDDYFNKLLDVSDMKRTASKLSMDACEEEFACVKQWSDETPTSLQLYTDHAKSAEIRRAKNKIQLSETKLLDDYDSRELKRVINDRNKYKDCAYSIKQIAARYVSGHELTSFEGAIDGLYGKIYKKVKDELTLKYVTQLYNSAIDFIKDKVSDKTGTVSKPNSPGFTQYARNKLELKQSLDKITGFLKMKDEKHAESFRIGELGDKGDLYIQKEWSMLGNTGYEKYKGSIKIEDLKKARKDLNDLKGGVFSDGIEDMLDNCRSSLSQIDSLDVFVGLRKYPTLNNDGKEYSPSNGEKAIIAIQQALDCKADFYVLDEPELSLGGEYIDNVIREKISKLGRAKKTVFIATHNANIAVRTLPYTSIYRKYDKGEYKTYVGNPFTNKLLNINDESDELSWREESMRTLEGGEVAFKNRGEIYESGK